MNEDTKFILLIVSFVLFSLGLMLVWNKPTPCKEITYQDLQGSHQGYECS
jgi:hypothetical protein